MTKKKCPSCGNGMIGQSRARYCSPACRQRAHRIRRGANRNACTVTVPAVRHLLGDGSPGVRSAEAKALLAALDAELGDAAELSGQRLEWTAEEAAVRQLIACEIDRKADLEALYRESDDAKTRVKLSAELRLLEASAARLLRQVKTKLPEPTSRRSLKAQRAAQVRWERDGA